MFLDLCYAVGLAVASPLFLWRDLATGRYRRHLAERFGQLPRRPRRARPAIWIHAVSLGEMRSLRTLVPALAAARPDYEVLLSTTTETGRAEAARLFPAHRIFYWPLDFSAVVRTALDAIRPSLVLLTELELWPNFTAECIRRGVPIAVINGRLTERSARGYARLGRLARDMFARPRCVCAQTPSIAERFVRLGTPRERVRVVASLKYDTAEPADPEDLNPSGLAAELGIPAGQTLLLAASTGPGEEAAVLQTYRQLCASETGRKLRLAIVPRHPQRFEEVAALILSTGWPLRRRSRPQTSVSSNGPLPVILGDSIGELRRFYALCHSAFVGRTLIPVGGSDLAEPAALGRAVIFGPSVHNFEDQAELLRSAEAGIAIANAEELTAAWAGLLREPSRAELLGQRARAALAARRGGTAATLTEILSLLHTKPVHGCG